MRAAEVCENRRKGSRPRLPVIVVLALMLAGGALASLRASGAVRSFAPVAVLAAQAQHPAGNPPSARAQSGKEVPAPNAAEASEQSESPWAILWRLINFAILAYGLVYLLRSPFAKYLDNRRTQIRADLVDAAETRRVSTERLAEIDQRLKSLPGEIEALRARGAEEIAAEEARIDRAAEAERVRLLEQTRREIEMQLRAAERELTTQAANLSVNLATERVKQTITDADQRRLVDRYLQQLGAPR